MLYQFKEFDENVYKPDSMSSFSLDPDNSKIFTNKIDTIIYFDNTIYWNLSKMYISHDNGETWDEYNISDTNFGASPVIYSTGWANFDICWDGTKFVAMWGYTGDMSNRSRHYFQTSTDGVNWTIPVENTSIKPSSAAGGELNDDVYHYITYGNGIYVATGEWGQNVPKVGVRGGNISISTDLVNWTNLGQKFVHHYNQADDNSFLAKESNNILTFRDGYFYYIKKYVHGYLYNRDYSNVYLNYVYKSSDGVNWTEYSTIKGNYGSHTENSNFSTFALSDKFLNLYKGPSQDDKTIIKISYDGVNWKPVGKLNSPSGSGEYSMYRYCATDCNNKYFFNWYDIYNSSISGLYVKEKKLYNNNLINNWTVNDTVFDDITITNLGTVTGLNYIPPYFILTTSKGLFYVSEDGKTWRKFNNYWHNDWRANQEVKMVINYNNFYNIALSGVGQVSRNDFPGNNQTWSSPVQLSAGTNANVGSFVDIKYGNGKLVVLTSTAYIFTSTDGINWTSNGRLDADWDGWTYNSIQFDGTKFIILGWSVYFESTDGVNWTKITRDNWNEPMGYYTISAHNGFEYIKVGLFNSEPKVITSNDSLKWTERKCSSKVGLASSDFNSHYGNPVGCYGNEMYVIAVTGSNTSGNAVIRTLRADIPYDVPNNPKVKKLYTFENGVKKYLIK